MAGTPSHCGGKLEGVGGFKREAVDKALGTVAKGWIRENFAPFRAQFGENDLCLHLPIGSELTHPDQARERSAYLNRRYPPDHKLVSPAQ
jgi:hypothetical protein